jgi:hypothetical protein
MSDIPSHIDTPTDAAVPEAPVPGARKVADKVVLARDPTDLDPTRYGDWEKNGRCIDF